MTKPHLLTLEVVATSRAHIVALMRRLAAQLEEDRLPGGRVTTGEDVTYWVAYEDRPGGS